METVLVAKISLESRRCLHKSSTLFNVGFFKLKFENLRLEAGRILEITAEWLFVLQHTFQYQ